MKSVAIVGGGMLGLTLAWRLAKRGRAVTVFERAPELGGLASAWELGGVTWDRHYHVTLPSDAYTRNIIEEIGLGDALRWGKTKTGFYTDGALLSMSTTLEFLRFPPLRLLDKLRLGANIFAASRLKDWRRMEQMRVEDWLRRWSGDRTFDRIWKPLLRSKLGDHYEHVSAAFIWATIARMYAARSGGQKEEAFGYVSGGYARVLERFGERLRAAGVAIELGATVERVSAGPAVVVAGERRAFDQVVVTSAAPQAAALCPDLTRSERALLAGVEYHGIVCASVLLSRPLGAYYVTNITDAAPFTGVIEMTALVDPEEVGGHHLVYLPKYVAPDDEVVGWSDDEVEARFLETIERMYPHFERSQVEAFRVSRVRYVFPVPTLGYSERVPSMRTSVPGLFTVNSSQIVNGTLNVNETVQLAERALATVLR